MTQSDTERRCQTGGLAPLSRVVYLEEYPVEEALSSLLLHPYLLLLAASLLLYVSYLFPILFDNSHFPSIDVTYVLLSLLHPVHLLLLVFSNLLVVGVFWS